MIEIIQTCCTGFLVDRTHSDRCNCTIQIIAANIIPVCSACLIQTMLNPHLMQITQGRDFLSFFIRQSSIVLHVRFSLNKPFIHSLCNAVLHIRESADMDHHRAMLCVVTAQITNRIKQQEVRHSLIHAGRQRIHFQRLLMGKREEQIHLFTPQRNENVSECGGLTKNLVCTNIIGWGCQRINKVSGEQIVANHFIFRLRVNENIGKRRCSDAQIRRLIKFVQKLTNTSIDCCRVVVFILRIDGCVIGLVVNQKHWQHDFPSGIVTALGKPFNQIVQDSLVLFYDQNNRVRNTLKVQIIALQNIDIKIFRNRCKGSDTFMYTISAYTNRQVFDFLFRFRIQIIFTLSARELSI